MVLIMIDISTNTQCFVHGNDPIVDLNSKRRAIHLTQQSRIDDFIGIGKIAVNFLSSRNTIGPNVVLVHDFQLRTVHIRLKQWFVSTIPESKEFFYFAGFRFSDIQTNVGNFFIWRTKFIVLGDKAIFALSHENFASNDMRDIPIGIMDAMQINEFDLPTSLQKIQGRIETIHRGCQLGESHLFQIGIFWIVIGFAHEFGISHIGIIGLPNGQPLFNSGSSIIENDSDIGIRLF
mmetsp:Transcript_39156/g.94676  ORF Transcript_39156/g.94676 Transcript_39156/m.94676 type:complete len:234 (+) Transcript_39156:2132-2833(+)